MLWVAWSNGYDFSFTVMWKYVYCTEKVLSSILSATITFLSFGAGFLIYTNFLLKIVVKRWIWAAFWVVEQPDWSAALALSWLCLWAWQNLLGYLLVLLVVFSSTTTSLVYPVWSRVYPIANSQSTHLAARSEPTQGTQYEYIKSEQRNDLHLLRFWMVVYQEVIFSRLHTV